MNLDALFAGQASPMPPELMRDEFHLPGGHDQQSHAGGSGHIREGKQGENKLIKVKATHSETGRKFEVEIIRNPDVEGLKRYLSRDVEEVRSLTDNRTGDMFIWESSEAFHEDMWQALVKAKLIKDADPEDERIDYGDEPVAWLIKRLENEKAGEFDTDGEDFSREKFHLPGQHDQQSHAGDDARNAEGAKVKDVYHGTYGTLVDSIRQRGLLPSFVAGTMNFGGDGLYDGDRGMSVFIAQDIARAWHWAEALQASGGGKPMVVHARIPIEEWNKRARPDDIANWEEGRETGDAMFVGSRIMPEWLVGYYTGDKEQSAYHKFAAGAFVDLFIAMLVDDRAEFHLPGQHDQQSHAGGNADPLDKRGTGKRTGGRPSAARIAAVTAMAKELGIKRFEIKKIPTPQNSWFSDIPPDAIIMGQFNPRTRTVAFNSDALKFSDRLVKDILRHEGGHAEFHAAFRSRATGVREYAKRNEKRLAGEGRISAYAKMFWRDYDDSIKALSDPLNDKVISRAIAKDHYDQAVNESFAELRRRFPDRPEKWPPSYRRLDALVRKHHVRA